MRCSRMYDERECVRLIELMSELDEESRSFNAHELANILGSYQKKNKNDIDRFFDEYLYDFLGEVGKINVIFYSDTIEDEEGGWKWDGSDLEASLDGQVYWSEGFETENGIVSFIVDGYCIEDVGDFKAWSGWKMEDDTGAWNPTSNGEWESCVPDDDIMDVIYEEIKSTTLDVPLNTVLPYTWDELWELARKL